MPFSPHTLLRATTGEAVQCVPVLAPLADWQDAARNFALPSCIWFADLSGCQTKAEVLAALAAQWELPAHFGHNWDALYDCLTDLKSRRLPEDFFDECPVQDRLKEGECGILVLIDHIPLGAGFDVGARAQLIECLEDAASEWDERGRRFRCFYRLD